MHGYIVLLRLDRNFGVRRKDGILKLHFFQGSENGEPLDIEKYLTMESHFQSLDWMDLGSGTTIEELLAELDGGR